MRSEIRSSPCRRAKQCMSSDFLRNSVAPIPGCLLWSRVTMSRRGFRRILYCRMAASDRLVIRPHLLLDVASGELLSDRAVVVEGARIAQVVLASEAPAEGPVVV